MVMTPSAATLEVTSRSVGMRTVLRVAGEVDMGSAAKVLAAARSALEHGAMELCLDLGGVSFLDSRGVHTLLAIADDARGRSRQLSIVCPDGAPRRTLALCGVERRLPLFASLPDALAA